MFLVIDLTKMPSYTEKLNNTKDVRDVIIGITGSVDDGDSAYEAVSGMRFGDKYCQSCFEIYCIKECDENCSSGLHIRKFATQKRMAEIANNAINSFSKLLTGKALYDALSEFLKMRDEEIIDAGFTMLKEFTEDESGIMKLGEWVVYTEDGLWFGYFDDNGPSYPTKKAAVDDIACASMDARRTPKIRRITSGFYIYTPKNYDTGLFDSEYYIEKLTVANLDRFKEMYYNIISEENDNEE